MGRGRQDREAGVSLGLRGGRSQEVSMGMKKPQLAASHPEDKAKWKWS